jgi:palmitoyltransferase
MHAAAARDWPKNAALVRRHNGFSKPLSCKQLLTIAVVIADAFLYGFLFMPLLEEGSRLLYFSIFLSALVITVFAGVWAMCVDPVDPLSTKEAELECDDETTLHCHLCDRGVQVDTKHCMECNKCVADFDHHCPWLNTCIGGRNYAAFFIAIVGALALLSWVVATGILLTIQLAASGGEHIGERDIRTAIFIIVVVVFNALLWLLDLMLVAFHIYLLLVRKTTYEFLTGKVSARQAKLRHEKLRQSKAVTSVGGANGLNGQVSPWSGNPSPMARKCAGLASPSSSGAEGSSIDGLSREGGAAQAAAEPERTSPAVEPTPQETTPARGGASPALSAVFSSLDSEIKRSVSLFVFGPGIDNVRNPEASPSSSTGVA